MTVLALTLQHSNTPQPQSFDQSNNLVESVCLIFLGTYIHKTEAQKGQVNSRSCHRAWDIPSIPVPANSCSRANSALKDGGYF